MKRNTSAWLMNICAVLISQTTISATATCKRRLIAVGTPKVVAAACSFLSAMRFEQWKFRTGLK